MFVIEGSRLLRRVFLEDWLPRNAFACRRPHVNYIEIFRAIVVIIEPTDAHARADVLDTSLGSNVGKRSVAIVAIEVLAPEIIDHIKIGPSIAIEVAPSATETLAGVVLIESRLGGYVAKRAIAIIAHHEVGRTILRVVIR